MDAWRAETVPEFAFAIPQSNKSLSPWHSFMTEQRNQGVSMKAAGLSWDGASQGEKLRHEAASRRKKNDAATERRAHQHISVSIPPEKTHLGLGCMEYPVRPSELSYLTEHGSKIKRVDARWKAKHNKLMVVSASDLEQEIPSQVSRPPSVDDGL